MTLVGEGRVLEAVERNNIYGDSLSPKILGGFRRALRNVFRIDEQPFARELSEETISIDYHRKGQLVIPRYADHRAYKETVIH